MAPRPKFALDEQSAITAELVDKALYDEDLKLDAAQLTLFRGQLAIILEVADADFKRNIPAAEVVGRLAGNLHQLRAQAGPNIWKSLIPVAQSHAVNTFLQQDPFTRWSFEKPRGYSGDATLLDIYYQHPSAQGIVAESTPLGQEIYAYTSNADSSVAGRERRDILAEYVDNAAKNNPQAEVLSVACGHLRESEKVTALQSGDLKRWVALDQDPQSIATVMQTCRPDIVKPLQGSVRGILKRSYKIGSFDLVYASGLYDYLTKPLGVRLLQRCWEMVKPGGMFLFANFSDEIQTDGYMESFMDWPLILRNEEDMLDIVNSALDRNTMEPRAFYGTNRNIVYTEIIKQA